MTIDDECLHVWYSPTLGYWKASGKEGDYGISRDRNVAVSMAVDAARTRGPSYRWHNGLRPVLVHAKERGTVVSRFVPTDGPGSPQWEQDLVP